MKPVEKNFCEGSPTQKMTLEPIFRILEAIVTEKLNCFKFVCYTVENSSIIKMITVTKPNHLQSPKRCQKIPQVGLSAGVGDLAPKNHSVKHSIKFHLGSQDEIPKKPLAKESTNLTNEISHKRPDNDEIKEERIKMPPQNLAFVPVERPKEIQARL